MSDIDYHGFDKGVEVGPTRKVTQTIALFIADRCGMETAAYITAVVSKNGIAQRPH